MSRDRSASPGPRKPHISRDDRLRTQTLWNAGHSAAEIRLELGHSARRISYAVNGPTTPQKRSSRPRVLTPEDMVWIAEQLTEPLEARRAPWAKLAKLLELSINADSGWSSRLRTTSTLQRPSGRPMCLAYMLRATA